MRIGHGFDAHRLAEGRELRLGGVSIPYEFGLAAHSDGDVVLHALCDALLGAAALGDIGVHFPPDDPLYSGVDSRELVRDVMGKLAARQLTVANADLTIVAERPRLRPYVAAMQAAIAEDLDVGGDAINVKATTTEKMGFTGRAEGIAAFAVVLLRS